MPEHIWSQALSALIGSIYDCALDPDHWDQTLSDLRDVFGGHNAGLTLIDHRHGRILVAKGCRIGPKTAGRARKSGQDTFLKSSPI